MSDSCREKTRIVLGYGVKHATGWSTGLTDDTVPLVAWSVMVNGVCQSTDLRARRSMTDGEWLWTDFSLKPRSPTVVRPPPETLNEETWRNLAALAAASEDLILSGASVHLIMDV